MKFAPLSAHLDKAGPQRGKPACEISTSLWVIAAHGHSQPQVSHLSVDGFLDRNKMLNVGGSIEASGVIAMSYWNFHSLDESNIRSCHFTHEFRYGGPCTAVNNTHIYAVGRMIETDRHMTYRDETCIYCYDLKTKQQSTVWVYRDEPKPTIMALKRSVSKRMTTSFFNKTGQGTNLPNVRDYARHYARGSVDRTPPEHSPRPLRPTKRRSLNLATWFFMTAELFRSSAQQFSSLPARTVTSVPSPTSPSATTLNATGSVLLERQCGGNTVHTKCGLPVSCNSVELVSGETAPPPAPGPCMLWVRRAHAGCGRSARSHGADGAQRAPAPGGGAGTPAGRQVRSHMAAPPPPVGRAALRASNTLGSSSRC
ncbi:hypothetical protein EVAR_96714_1 [Eumeta japonica]|uniref:Uncharacterized protein n=1 Tax=Eumeta variegata TaxID=151549 RepID=A0A4C1WJZ2_EUMVA|nr:hypothetical protein EVAR_96714_1 [Eumeta japonica]